MCLDPYTMIRFRESVEIDSDPERVFIVVSNISTIPEFWHGTRELSGGPDVYRIRFAFPRTGTVRFSMGEGRFETHYLTGPIKGMKVEEVSGEGGRTRLSSTWEVSLSLYLRLFEGRIAEHFRTGTRHALMRIKHECERASAESGVLSPESH